jgi:hypothetical protein
LGVHLVIARPGLGSLGVHVIAHGLKLPTESGKRLSERSEFSQCGTELDIPGSLGI